MALFIQVDVDGAIVRERAGLAKKLVEVCPVKIFAPGTEPESVRIVEANVDECTLCDLCTQACPDGVKIKKLY